MGHACVAMLETRDRIDPHAHDKRGHGTQPIHSSVYQVAAGRNKRSRAKTASERFGQTLQRRPVGVGKHVDKLETALIEAGPHGVEVF